MQRHNPWQARHTADKRRQFVIRTRYPDVDRKLRVEITPLLTLQLDLLERKATTQRRIGNILQQTRHFGFTRELTHKRAEGFFHFLHLRLEYFKVSHLVSFVFVALPKLLLGLFDPVKLDILIFDNEPVTTTQYQAKNDERYDCLDRGGLNTGIVDVQVIDIKFIEVLE